MGHVPIEVSSLCYHFLNNNERNILTALVTGKQNWELGLVVPAKLFLQTEERKSAETLEMELPKKENWFPTVTIKFRKKGTFRKFCFM